MNKSININSSLQASLQARPLLQIHQGRMGYSHSFFSQEIQLEILQGDFWHLVGPNGGGKSTLLKILIGEIPLLAGHRQIYFHPREIGYVPQFKTWNHFIPLSLAEFVEQGNYQKRQRNWVQHVLDLCQLSSLGKKSIHQLSGGELQRASLARAMVNKPQILFIDELGTYLDPQNEERLHEIVCNYYRGEPYGESSQSVEQRTVVMINHNQQRVAQMPGKILWINQRADEWEQVEQEEMQKRHKRI